MSDGCCETTLDASGLERRQRQTLVVVLVINVVTFVIMVAGSLHSGSSALLSGALDNLGDAVTYALSLAVVGASCAAKARVALFKGMLIFGAAVVVAVQIGWRLAGDLETPIFQSMGLAAVMNLIANAVCLGLLFPHRQADVNMASVYECSRNDIFDGVAVLLAAIAGRGLDSPWPDVIIASALVLLFLRSAYRVLRSGWQELSPPSAAS